MSSSNRSAWSRVVAALALVLALGVAGTAFAAPPDPTLGIAGLKAKLDSSGSGTLEGYFKTVDKGSTIETIPVTILAITGGSTAKSALIMFEATGPQIGKFGGIVAGMSGSPVYVEDDGVDKVVGAVSYGDYFTKGGTGLATPIESMRLIRTSYVPEFVSLTRPLVTTDGVVNRIVISSSPEEFAVQSRQGAFVASPLSSVFIGGLDPRSAGYKLLAKTLTGRGQSVVELGAKLGAAPAVGDASFETSLVPGAAVAVLETRGDMWIGGVGTVTYTDTDTVLAFGHPAFGAGPTSLYMTNAWIDGVWPSLSEPYKIGRPTALRGTITQDRSAGILGVLDQFPTETTFTASAFDTDRGVSASSTVYMSRKLLDAGTADPSYVLGIDPITAATGVYLAGQDLMDAEQTPGSAEVTTTVTATDGTTTYTVSIPNRVDSGYDTPLAVIQDAATIVNTLQQVKTDGVHTCSILSVDLAARYTAERNWAQIVGVELPEGLKVGDNPVKVSARVVGIDPTQTIDATVTVPSGTRPVGSVVAMSQSFAAQNSSDSGASYGAGGGMMDSGIGISIPNGPSHISLAEAASGLNATLPNNVVTVMFVPTSADGGGSTYESPFAVTPTSIVATVPTEWVFNSYAVTSVSKLTASVLPSTINYQDMAMLTGMLTGPSTAATVAVYATPAGASEQYLGTFATSEGPDGFEFQALVGPLQRNTSIRVRYEGDSSNSAASAVVSVRVRASVGMSASSKSVKSGRTIALKASTRPSWTGGGQVVFEYNDSGSHWRAIATRTLVSGGSSATTSASWKVAKGKHKVRVRYLGGTLNAASTSASTVVTGK